MDLSLGVDANDAKPQRLVDWVTFSTLKLIAVLSTSGWAILDASLLDDESRLCGLGSNGSSCWHGNFRAERQTTLTSHYGLLVSATIGVLLSLYA